jgi:hypothetical protein
MSYPPRTPPLRITTLRLTLALLAATGACCAAASCVGTANEYSPAADAGVESSDHLGDSSPSGGPCTNLQCQVVSCPGAMSTTVTGVVHTPAVANPDPLYNAVVYVPNGRVEPFTKGVSCDHCGAPASGAPIVDTLTAADGSFTLVNVPAGDDIPLVIQLGRWRRQVTIPHVEACQTTAISDDLTHLPGKRSDGDIPLMAIATGALDPLECVLRKIGIDDAEFTAPTGPGRVHVYVQNGLDLKPPAPAASTLWSSTTTLDAYDLVLLPCEGEANLKPLNAMQNLIDYATAGGRVFATHYSYVWIYDAPAPFPSTAKWSPDQPAPGDPLTGLVDTSFAKGKAMADWLSNVGASPSYAEIAIETPRHDVDSVTSVSQEWITSVSPMTAQHFSFNTPIGVDAGAQCGKVVYSDFHVAANEADGGAFPLACAGGPLTAQEKVIEFMLFDLASCVQNERQPPTPPPAQ